MLSSTPITLSLALISSIFASGSFATILKPDLQSLQWTHNNTHYWAPLDFNATSFLLASPANAADPASLSKRASVPGTQEYTPCTIITLNSSTTTLSAAVLETILSDYDSIDDVWTPELFLQCLFIQYDGSEEGIPVEAGFVSGLKGVEKVYISTHFNATGLPVPQGKSITSVVSNCEFSNGPYIAVTTDCYSSLSMMPVYTLHTDTYESFMEGAYHGATPDSFISMHVSIPGTRLPAIIVPSRIASLTSTEPGPLAGLRFAVKDIFHIKGLKTSGGSRAYYQTYGHQNYTTETVQFNLDGGAAMIGKTRTIPFALGPPRMGDEIDFLNPWNARGDGYQSTGGSSSGSSSAITAYDWVDFTIGSDTGGSIRFPASLGGFYGYKPSHGVFNLTGILVAIAEQDTPGHMARSPAVFTKVGRHWLSSKALPQFTKFPTKVLLYADEGNQTQPEAKTMIDKFYADLAALVNATTSSINMTETYLTQNISGTNPPEPFTTYMEYVYGDLNNVQGWDAIGEPLVSAYGAQNNGAYPPLDPPVNQSWADGANSTTRARYNESDRRRAEFGDFFNTYILPSSNETCSESIFAHSYHGPGGDAKTALVRMTVLIGWYNGFYSNMAGSPEIVVPIGQVQYLSPYTRIMEWQPVTVTLGVARGCDHVLFELVDKLVEAGLLKEVLAGKVAYEV